MENGRLTYRTICRKVETGYEPMDIWVAFVTGWDHDCAGMGLTKQEALDKMLDEVEQATGTRWRVAGAE